MKGSAGAGVCSYVCMYVCVSVCADDREGPMVFGRHCVRSIPKKQQQQQQQRQQQQQSIQTVIRNNVTIAMQCGKVAAVINKEAAATIAFKSVMTLKGVFCQPGAVGTRGHDSRSSKSKVDVFAHPDTQTH